MIKRFWSIFLIICITFTLGHNNVYAAANTLGELKQELANLKKQKAEADASKNKTQAEINAENAKISDAHSAIEKAESDIALSKSKIEESNKKIEDTKDEISQLLVSYEIMQGENSFMQYISGATSMTDLMMRADAISQILIYNQERLTELEKLITTNEELQIELAKKQDDLEKKIVVYENSLANLKDDLSSLVEVTLDISSQITAQQKLIDYYEDIGCKNDELLSKCIDVANSAVWMKPTTKGYISSGFGYRSFYLNGKPYSDFHNAVDVSGISGGSPLYAAANGTVAAVIKKASCGGNQVYIHVRVQGVAYTLTYAHMKDVYVKVGDQVNQQTVIGTLGGGGSTLKKNGGWDTCSTGWHVHFGVAKGFYLGGGSEGYSSYSKYIANSIVPPMMPSYGKWYYSRY